MGFFVLVTLDSEFLSVMFHGKQGGEGYYSADCFCETFPVIASDKVIKGYERLWEYPMYITLYNLFNPVAHPFRFHVRHSM